MQRNSIAYRLRHMEDLVEHYAERRSTSKTIDVKKIIQTEMTRRTSAKYKWYLKGRHGTIRNFLVPD